MPNCAQCAKKCCRTGSLADAPVNCPCLDPQQEQIREEYRREENARIASKSACTEAEGYCRLTRLEETMDFADRCGFHKLGLAFCVGLSREAEILSRVLRHNGFEVCSAACKNGSVPKEFLGLTDAQKVRPGAFEPMCNPIGQALLLAKEATQLNILLGLCVGHDSLFFKYSQAPVTVLAVKDRVLAHNPLGALYLSEGYYKDKLYSRRPRAGQ